MSHFVCTYVGNKFKEFEKYKAHINLNGIKKVIEPFAGSCAMSFKIWRENKDKDLEFYINDLAPATYNIYEKYKTMTSDEFRKEIQDKLDLMNTKEKWEKERDKKRHVEDPILHIVLNKFYGYRPGLFPTTKKMEFTYKWNATQLEFYEFINSPNVFISNKNWFDIFEEHKDDTDAMFLFDPPYLASNNSYYDLDRDAKHNVYEFFASNEDEKFNSRIYFILEPNWIVKLLFKKHNFVFEYNKRYDISGRNTTHCVIEW